jgi:hypothetical protein
MTETGFIAGLDLGQAQDFTALAVLARTTPTPAGPPAVTPGCMGTVYTVPAGPKASAPEPRRERRYAVRHLERFPLGMAYPALCARVVQLFAAPPLAGGTLAVDQTGVGRAVVDLLRQARPKATLRPVTITAGLEVVPDAGGWRVPKKDLVGVLQVLLQSRRLQVARQLPHAATLVKELEAFRVKVTASAHETFEAWRERDHDDLVLAVALAAWLGERGLQAFWVRC